MIDTFKNFNTNKLIVKNSVRCGCIPFIVEDNKWYVIMVLNAYLLRNKEFSLWGLPKGHIKRDESYAMCCWRELYEETNIQLKKILPYVSDNDYKLKIKNTFYFPYILPIKRNELKEMIHSNDKREIAEVRIIDLDKICNFQLNKEAKLCLKKNIYRVKKLAKNNKLRI